LATPSSTLFPYTTLFRSNSMLACAEYEGGVPVSASDFDQNKYLLNLLDGTLDLSTGRMREHRREDLISKLVHFNFNPKARCPILDRKSTRLNSSHLGISY